MWILSLLAIVFIGFGVSDWLDGRKERQRFNDGVCPNCGEHLKYKDETDYQGRIYVCPKCGHVAKIPPCSHIDKRYCNVSDEVVWTIHCQNCKSKEYCQYNKKED